MRHITRIYFEGGEPFLFYPLLLEGLRQAAAFGFETGIVTNAYWATSVEDAILWLRPLLLCRLVDLSISDDAFHSGEGGNAAPEAARKAARELGIPCDTISIERPADSAERLPDCRKGSPVTGGKVLFKGRAAELLTVALPCRPTASLVSCPHEELAEPERVHVDAFGNVQVCQGISIGNVWQRRLRDIIESYAPHADPIIGPLIRGGPARLADKHGIALDSGYVDECHACYMCRKALLNRFPDCLAPREVYGDVGPSS